MLKASESDSISTIDRDAKNMAKILVVDDSDVTRDGLRKSLEAAGHVVLDTDNGADGLAKITANSDLDLVITDFHMPGMSGLEMIRRAKASLGHLPFLVLVISSDISESARRLGRELGVTAWGLKPVDLNALLGVIAEIGKVKTVKST